MAGQIRLGSSAMRLHGRGLGCDVANRVNEAVEADSLFPKALVDGAVVEISGGVKFLLHAGNKDAIGIGMCIAIAKDHLQLLDSAQAAPYAIGLADERDRFAIEAFGKFEHVDEILEHAGK